MIDQAAGLAALLALGGIIYFLSVVGLVAWRLRHPPRRTYASALARSQPADPSELSPPLAYEAWSFRSRGLDLPVWDIRGRRPRGPVIVFTPGWGDSRIGSLPRALALAQYASRLIAWDPPGLGEAPGTSSLGIHEPEDLAALVGHLNTTLVVLVGWSLGGGISIAAAADPRLAGRVHGVIAEAPYRFPDTPARNVLRAASLPHGLSLTGAMWLCRLGGRRRRDFDRCAHAARLPCPLLVVHGDADAVSPPADGRAIADAAPRAHFAAIPAGDHNRLWTDPAMLEATLAAVAAFLDRLGNYDAPDDGPPEKPDG